jgi:hypothetical protein
MSQNQVWPESADEADHLTTVLQRGHELAVMVVEDFVGSADNRTGGFSFGATTTRQLVSWMDVVAGVAIGQAHHLDDVACGAVQSGCPTGCVIGIIGMRADDEES